MNRLKSLLFVCLLALSAAAVAAPAKTYTVGTLRVEQYGNHGRPLILIPGLGSGSWVWKDTIEHFRNKYVVYALTLAGFDGVPAPAGESKLFDRADSSLLQLIVSRKIDRPVLIGHSLGGTLAIRFAEEHSDMVGGVISVDGLPVFPAMARMDADQRKSMAESIGAQMAQATPAEFRAQQLSFMQNVGVIDPAEAAKYAKLQGLSDPAATGKYAAEDMAADYRPGLGKIGVPLLLIAPYNPPDYAKAVRGRPPLSEEQLLDFYRMLITGAPHAEVVAITPARHFVMLDQPEKFRHAVAAFLGKL